MPSGADRAAFQPTIKMNHGSLFSGIGGFDLAAQWMGWNNVFHCEKNEFRRKVLNHYWPESISYEDVTQTDFDIHAGSIDILTGGFPCQPYSTAGKRLGKEDDRHLWPEMLRAIREIKPSYIVGENVRGLLSWNGGLVFDEVQADLETEGYEVLPFLLPACAVNAPHRRDRIWFVAYANSSRGFCLRRHETRLRREIKEQPKYPNSCSYGHAANSASGGWLQDYQEQLAEQLAQRVPDWRSFPTQPPVCGRDDGLPAELDGITLSRHRRESIKAYGNAIVPQVALQIFKAIEETYK